MSDRNPSEPVVEAGVKGVSPRPPRSEAPAVTHYLAWIVLAISLAASTGGWLISRQQEELAASQRFDQEVDRLQMALEERMLVYEYVLRGVVGLYDSSLEVERSEWRSYLQSVSIHKRFPGIGAVGFVAHVPRQDLKEFLTQTREDGAPGFRLQNEAPNEVAYVVKYIEPEELHRTVLGFDMNGDPVRRAVADKARDSGAAVLSGGLALLDEAPDGQSAVVMMLPVYRRGTETRTVADRQTNIQGWVYARFITEELIRGIARDQPLAFEFEIFDGTTPNPAQRLFGSQSSPVSGSETPARFKTQRLLKLAMREWTLRFASLPVFEASVSRSGSTFAAMGGSVISLLLFWIAWSLSQTRQRAEAMALDMTTALRDANERLEHERFLLRTLMDNVPDRIYFKDAESRFLRNSRALLERFGLADMAEAMGKSDFDFFTEAHARQAFEDEKQIMETGQPMTKEERETWQEQPDTWVLSTKMPLRNELGQIVGTFGISRDITDRKRAEEAMRRAKEEAEAANVAKSQFLASMSHELRTPLNSVIGFAGVLLKNKSGGLSASELNFLERIQANGKHLLALINQILDLSKIEARKMELEVSSVALDVLVNETVSQQEGLVRDRPVELVADLPSRLGLIKTDAAKLKQVLINLIGNALKFTERGTVTVRVVADSQDHRPVRVEVIDTGIGISPGKLGAVFEAFRQAETGTDRKYGGTGLGLTISQALCQLMGHRIEASSELGKGSTFSVILGSADVGTVSPVVAAPKPPPPMVSSAVSPPCAAAIELQGTRVLVIDDESDARALLSEMLSEFGCQVLMARSGEEGLRMAREARPHLITVDLMMPTMQGADVIRAIKADPELRGIPVVVVSIVAAECRGRILGAVDLLEKPIQRDEFLAVLQRNVAPPRPRILVVDDEEDARRLMVAQLQENAEVDTAGDGREALRKLDQNRFDLILLDLMMPVMDGRGFLDALRVHPRHGHIPVVVITAKELTEAEREQLQRQTQDVLKKAEVFENDLKNVLYRVLREAHRGVGPKRTASEGTNEC